MGQYARSRRDPVKRPRPVNFQRRRPIRLSLEQDTVIRHIRERESITFAELADDALRVYVSTAFGVAWPAAPRPKRSGRFIRPGKTETGQFGITLSDAQNRVIESILERHPEITFSLLLDMALANYVPRQFGIAWPAAVRRDQPFGRPRRTA